MTAPNSSKAKAIVGPAVILLVPFVALFLLLAVRAGVVNDITGLRSMAAGQAVEAKAGPLEQRKGRGIYKGLYRSIEQKDQSTLQYSFKHETKADQSVYVRFYAVLGNFLVDEAGWEVSLANADRHYVGNIVPAYSDPGQTVFSAHNDPKVLGVMVDALQKQLKILHIYMLLVAVLCVAGIYVVIKRRKFFGRA